MQINLSFDTENERLENLQKLVTALQQLIDYRIGNSPKLGVPRSVPQKPLAQPIQQAAQPIQQPQPVQAPVQEKRPEKQKTSGGCRVIPFEDMSDQMSKIFSNRRL